MKSSQGLLIKTQIYICRPWCMPLFRLAHQQCWHRWSFQVFCTFTKYVCTFLDKTLATQIPKHLQLGLFLIQYVALRSYTCPTASDLQLNSADTADLFHSHKVWLNVCKTFDSAPLPQATFNTTHRWRWFLSITRFNLSLNVSDVNHIVCDWKGW